MLAIFTTVGDTWSPKASDLLCYHQIISPTNEIHHNLSITGGTNMPKIHSWTSHRTEKAFLYHKKHATPVVPQLMILMDFSKFEQKIVHQNVHLLFNKEVGYYSQQVQSSSSNYSHMYYGKQNILFCDRIELPTFTNECETYPYDSTCCSDCALGTKWETGKMQDCF